MSRTYRGMDARYRVDAQYKDGTATSTYPPTAKGASRIFRLLRRNAKVVKVETYSPCVPFTAQRLQRGTK
jgi:hypothetical protein